MWQKYAALLSIGHNNRIFHAQHIRFIYDIDSSPPSAAYMRQWIG